MGLSDATGSFGPARKQVMSQVSGPGAEEVKTLLLEFDPQLYHEQVRLHEERAVLKCRHRALVMEQHSALANGVVLPSHDMLELIRDQHRLAEDFRKSTTRVQAKTDALIAEKESLGAELSSHQPFAAGLSRAQVEAFESRIATDPQAQKLLSFQPFIDAGFRRSNVEGFLSRPATDHHRPFTAVGLHRPEAQAFQSRLATHQQGPKKRMDGFSVPRPCPNALISYMPGPGIVVDLSTGSCWENLWRTQFERMHRSKKRRNKLDRSKAGAKAGTTADKDGDADIADLSPAIHGDLSPTIDEDLIPAIDEDLSPTIDEDLPALADEAVDRFTKRRPFHL